MRYLLLGIFANFATGFDDMLSRLPVMLAVTKTRAGKVAFATGTMVAILLIVIMIGLVGPLVAHLPHFDTVAAFVIFGLALFVLLHRTRVKPAKRPSVTERLAGRISTERFISLMGVGFVVAILTLVDDSLAYIPLFAHGLHETVLAAVGVLTAALIQLYVIISFAERIERLRYRREMTAGALIIYATLILLGFV